MDTKQDVRWPKDKISAEASLKYWLDEAKRNNDPTQQHYYSNMMVHDMIKRCRSMLEKEDNNEAVEE